MSAKTAYVAYYRCSTEKQNASGLGLEAQQHAVNVFTQGVGVVATYTEIESGSKADRPQLALAIDHAKRTGARLLIAKLDRLARNVGFVANLMNAGVAFTCCDMPNASEFEINIRAALAQEERRLISERTKAALARAKARGVKLGGYRGGRNFNAADRALGRATAVGVIGVRVDAYTATVLPHVAALKDQGLSLNAIAKALTANGVATPSGGTSWRHQQVARVLARAA